MIKLILQMLALEDNLNTEEIRIAKGKNELKTKIKDIYKDKKIEIWQSKK